MKVAFIHTDDVRDKRNWSGTTYYIFHALEKQFSDILVLAPLVIIENKFLKFILSFPERIQRKITGKSGFSFYSTLLFKKQGILIDDFIEKNQPDIVISTTSHPFVFTSFQQPLVIITDATLKILFYDYSNGSDLTKKNYDKLNNNFIKVCNKTSLIVSSSGYCTKSLRDDYGFSDNKIATIPFGANMDEADLQFVERKLETEKPVQFLFVGKGWKRKGGDKAVAICDLLKAQGVNLNLTVIGSIVPEEFKRDYIINYVFLDKNIPKEYNKLIECYRQAHFFIVFSSAEMYGVVFCEAAGMGLPVITSAVGGIVDIVVNNETGIILPTNTTVNEYSTKIINLISKPDTYKQMSFSARKRYETLLNWNVFTETLVERINSFFNSKLY